MVRLAAVDRNDVWEVHVDDNSKLPYYYNPATDVTTWEPPAQLASRRSVESTVL